jgi:hypothetical protein
MALDEGKMNARSECSFVPNQALYQAEPQPNRSDDSVRVPVEACIRTHNRLTLPRDSTDLEFSLSKRAVAAYSSVSQRRSLVKSSLQTGCLFLPATFGASVASAQSPRGEKPMPGYDNPFFD